MLSMGEFQYWATSLHIRTSADIKAVDQMADPTNRAKEREKDIQHTVEERSSLVRDEGALSSLAEGVQVEAPASVQRLSIIPEYEPGKTTGKDSHESERQRECDITSSIYTTQKYSRRSSSSSSSSSDSRESDTGADCAGIVLKCLFCRFYDLCLMLPDSCDRATNHCCPTYKQFSATVDTPSSNDWRCNCDCDFGLFDACQETGECLELAMEISEICYR